MAPYEGYIDRIQIDFVVKWVDENRLIEIKTNIIVKDVFFWDKMQKVVMHI